MCSIYFQFQTYFFPEACCLISIKSFCLLPLHQFFLLLYKDTEKDFGKKKQQQTISLKKIYPFYSTGIKEMDMCTKYPNEVEP